ncbi:hypothetical protein QQ008_23035 [Fulvivirgaceae bacterium BMA10]|uniref:Sortilin N-terminal domain-containing protein n=1 Tax=Splendidivirga corallicola TaxID=3051826 RepID=A0ABT8KU39_9BACT|nr:hypothetical protein [Fulvivirgaceae bacterium BMA10]
MCLKRKLTVAILSLFIAFELYSQALEYRNIGPSRGGRVTTVRGVDSQPNVFYMGATGGGLWKSENYGISWENISDGYFSSPSIGAIAVYQKDPNIIYVGTGSDAIRSNVIVGKGIYKSDDAGKTWEFAGLKEAGQIGALEIHPDNPEVAYAAVVGQPFRKSKERGVYKTIDGGESWEQILYHADSVGAVDLELAPDNPNIIYAAMWRAERKPWTIISGGATDGIFKSSDGGQTWKRLSKGLPTALFGKADLAVSKDNPARVWAQIQASEGQEGIYKSDDYGNTWEKIEMPENVHKSVMYRPFYFTNIDANPQNADNIWVGTKRTWTTYDGGGNWQEMVPPHADHHDLWINPIDTLVIICGNDGGAGISRDGGMNWTHQFNQPTAELYTCDVDDQYPYYLYSGQQDNSTIRVPSRTSGLNVLNSHDEHGLEKMMFWERVGGCETGPVVPKPGDPNIVYANCKGQFSVYNHTSGREQVYYVGAESLYGNHPGDITYRFQRVTPIEVSPHDPDVVYYGSQYLHKTSNGGVNWETISPDLTAYEPQYRMRSGEPIDEDISGEEYYSVLYAIQESPIQPGVIWTGANDGLIHLTKDGGKTWTNVTPEMPEGGRVSNIEASPHHAGKAYVAIYRDYLGDDSPYFYKTYDFGMTWIKITEGIPQDHPSRVLREDPDREGLLYAGTEFGIFVSFDDGSSWKSLQKNLPIVPITDINVFRKDLAISTLGRSFWVLDDISPLHSYDDQAMDSFKVFKPRNVNMDKQFIYFVLPDNPSDTIVNFEFKRGAEIIHNKEESLSKLPADDWGLRKTEWDLRHYLKNGEKDFRGPLVAPGTYEVTVTYGGKEQRHSFDFELNPDIKNAGVILTDLQEQEALALKVAKLYLAVDREIQSIEEQLKKVKVQKKKEQLQSKLAQLKKGPRRYDKPKLIDHIDYLYDMVTETQQKLGKDASLRYEHLHEKFKEYKNR